MEYYSAIKSTEILTRATNMDQSQKHYAKWKKLGTKGHILNNSIYRKCPDR